MEAAPENKWSEDPRSTAELLALARHEWLLDEDPQETPWETMCILQHRGSPEVFEAGERWCRSEDAMERRLGAIVLRRIGKFGQKPDIFHADAVALLLPLLSDPDPAVIKGAAYAFGERHDPSAIPHLLPLINHPDAELRLGVVNGLSCLDDPRAIAGLIELSRDGDAAVRNWATFGLGQLTEVDTPELRDALMARTVDEDHDARGEALIGLANRRDPRVVEPIVRELTGDHRNTYAVEAAEAFPHPAFCQHLLPMHPSIATHQPWCLKQYENTLTACCPSNETQTALPPQDEEGQET